MAKPENNLLLHIYEDSTSKIQFDSFTAASNGDLSYFSKYIVGSGWTPIMYACARGHALLVSYLVMCGVKTNCSSKSKVTPLMLAVASGDLATVECAFNPADIERQDYRRWTALYYAVYFLQENCVRFLLSKGANVNTQDFQNETPLLIAIKSGNETIVNLLLQTAVNLDVMSYKNESAVMLAKVSENKKIRDSVLNRKEYLDKSKGQRDENRTPLKKFLKIDKENRTPSPLHKARNFLGLRISKSFSYSPNKMNKTPKLASLCGSPVQKELESEKKSLWKMCVTTNPVPSTGQFNVEELLSSLGLEKYWPIFRDEEVDFETLLTFSEENLKEIGITFSRKRPKLPRYTLCICMNCKAHSTQITGEYTQSLRLSCLPFQRRRFDLKANNHRRCVTAASEIWGFEMDTDTPFGPRKKILSAIQNLRTYYNNK